MPRGGRGWDRALQAALALGVLARIPLAFHPLGRLANAEHMALYKAWTFWNWGHSGLSLDPHTAGWPGLSFYLAFLAQVAFLGIGALAGLFRTTGDFEAAFLLHPWWTITATQLAWTAVWAAGAWAAAGWCRRVAGPGAALVLALGLALDPLLLEESLTIGPDVPAFALLWLSLERLSRFEAEGRTADVLWAAALCGLGAAAKYYPLIVLPALLWTLHARTRAGKFPARLAAACCGLAAAAFLAGSPFLVLDLAGTRRDVGTQMQALAGGHFGQSWHGPAWLAYVSSVLPGDLGWIAFAAGLAGLALLVARRPASRVGAAVATGVLVIFGQLTSVYPRYALPALPPLWAGAGVLAVFAGSRLPGAARALPAAVLLAAWLLGTAIPADGVWLRPDTVAAARRDLPPLVRGGNAILREVQTPDLPTLQDADRLRTLVDHHQLSDRFRDEVDTLVAIRQSTLFLSSILPEVADAYYDARYLGAVDFVLTSSGVGARYEAEPDRFPRELLFYRLLRQHARLVGTWGGGRLTGPTLTLYATNAGAFAVLDSVWRAAEVRLPPAHPGGPPAREATFHSEMGQLFLERHRAPEAVRELERSVALDSTRASVLRDLAEAYGQQDRVADAVPRLEAAARLDPASGETRLELIGAKVALGRYDGVLAGLQKLQHDSTVVADGLMEIGRQLEADRRPLEATLAYEAVLRREPSAGIHLALGRVRASVGYPDGAAQDYVDALRLAPGLTEAREALAKLLPALSPGARSGAERVLSGLPGPSGAAREPRGK